MILSHEHRFIFLKTNKTAGTSVEIALSRVCGPEDVITPISRKDEILRKELGGIGPQNYRIPGRPRYYNHMSACEVIELSGEDVWNEYFKFCIERNPWDRVISLYYFNHKKEPRPSISEFIRSGELQILKKRGIALYTLGGEICVDRIIDYAHLEQELDEIRRELKIPEPLKLPRAKGQFRTSRCHYSEYFDSDERALVEQLFAKEIALMGFKFETRQ